jgi:hypothetical protein
VSMRMHTQILKVLANMDMCTHYRIVVNKISHAKYVLL